MFTVLAGSVLALGLLASVGTPTALGAADPSAENQDEAPADVGDQSRITFGVQPANAEGGIDERAFFQYGLPPQASVFDYVGILNYGDEPIDLSLYATDAISSESGDFTLLQGDEAPADIGSWVQVGEPTTDITVPPADGDGPGKVVLPVGIAVPENATPGDHAGGVVAVLTTLGENPDGQNVELQQRVAARVYVRVDGELAPGISVQDVSGTYRAGRFPWQAGTLDLSYTLVNSGNVRMGLQSSASITGPFGLGEARGSATPVTELLPLGTVAVEQSIEGVWPLGVLTAAVRVEPLAAPGAEAPELSPVTTEATIRVVPWQLLLAVLILVMIVGGLLWLRRQRRRSSDRVRPPVSSPTAAASVPVRAPAEDVDVDLGETAQRR